MKTKITNHTRYIKGTALSLITATFLLSGCGSSGIDDVYDRSGEGTTTQADYTVQVVDDAVLGSKVMANECTGYEEKGDGWYTLTGCSNRPKAIIADGGYITLNVDGNDTNVSMGFPLMINTNMIAQAQSYTATPLTTLLATVNDYAELEKLQKSLGFATIQDMFKDDNSTRDLQRTLNSFFLEAQSNGVDINNFSDFTKDFREMVTQASGNTPLEVIKQAKTKLKEDFDAHTDKYMNKYGVVFSGFVTNTDYTADGGSAALLKNIGNKFRGNENQVIFSGFIFDDIIGSSNDNYDQNATITIQNLNTSEFLGLDDNNNTSLKADAYGKYTVKIDKSKIVPANAYLLKGIITNVDNEDVELQSILTGNELLAKFKTNLNTADIPDLTISNVTTAKVAILDKQGVVLTNPSDVLAAKKTLETTNQATLLDVATGIKTLIDGNATTPNNQNTYEYIKTTINNDGTFVKPTDMTADFGTFKTKIEANKTLVTQLTSTKYEKFKIKEDDIKGKRLVITVTGDVFPTTIRLFSNNSYTRESKDNNLNPIFNIGKWAINDNGDLTLTNIADNSISTIALDKLELAKATYNSAKQFTGTTTNPRGSITKDSISKFIEVTTLADIDLTKYSAPMVEFTNDNLKNKRLYEVYPENGEYKDAVYIFNPTGTTVQYSTDVQASNGTQMAISITDGILTIGGDTFKIKKAYPTKLIVTKNGNTSEDIELFYSAVNAAASASIKTYDNYTYKQRRFTSSDWNIDSANNNNGLYNTASISSTPFTLKATPIDGDVTNYNLSKVSIISDNFNSTQMIGTKTELAITKNLGDSSRQRVKTSTRYILPNFDDTQTTSGLLLVEVQLRYNKLVYNLKVRDIAGVEHNILDTPVTIVEENTLNKKYSVMTILLDNQIAIRVFDGISSYYQYIDLANLWGNKPNDLKYFKYPTALKNSVDVAFLDDDGTGTLYKGKMNTPIEAKVSNFEIINGKLENSYAGGYSSVCTTSTNPVSTAPIFTNAMIAGHTFYEVYFDTDGAYDTTANKNIGKFVMNTDGTFTATGLLGDDTGHIATGTWSIVDGKLNTAVSQYDGNATTYAGSNTIQLLNTDYTRTSWINFNDPNETDINYYFTDLAKANIFGYTTDVSDVTTDTNNTTVDANTTIASLTQEIFANNSTTNFESWGATPTLEQYNSLTGTNISFLSQGFGDAWYESYPDSWESFGSSTVAINPAPTTSSSGAINFTEANVHKVMVGGSWMTYNTSKIKSNRLDYVSNGVYTIYNDTNTTAQEEIKFVKEFAGDELNNLDLNVTFDSNDKASMILTKALTTYYDWNEPQQDWGSSTPITYSSLESFISAHSNGYFTTKEGYNNVGIAFASGSTGTSGTLVEVTNTGTTITTNAGTWSITNGILNLNITVSGYNYTPAFTIKDTVVWRGEKRLAGNLQAGILFNTTALSKLVNKYIGTSAPDTTEFTENMIAGHTFYEVYFDDGDAYQTSQNKNIGKFVMNADHTFTAIGLLGDDGGHIATGTWSITNGKLTTSVTQYDGSTVTPYVGTNTIEASNGYIQTAWVNDNNTSETDINYYFTDFATANNFGYNTGTTYYNALQDSDIAGHEIVVSTSDLGMNKQYSDDHTFMSGGTTPDSGTWMIVEGKLFHRWSGGDVEVHSFNVKPAVNVTITNETYNVSGNILQYNTLLP